MFNFEKLNVYQDALVLALDMVRGSCYELIPLLKISLDLGYITLSEYNKFYETADDLSKRINALKKSVNR